MSKPQNPDFYFNHYTIIVNMVQVRLVVGKFNLNFSEELTWSLFLPGCAEYARCIRHVLCVSDIAVSAHRPLATFTDSFTDYVHPGPSTPYDDDGPRRAHGPSVGYRSEPEPSLASLSRGQHGTCPRYTCRVNCWQSINNSGVPIHARNGVTHELDNPRTGIILQWIHQILRPGFVLNGIY